jgi:hypothetical protein
MCFTGNTKKGAEPMSENRQPNPNYRPPASMHVSERTYTPEVPKPDALITITVAEYHLLTKAATLLEAILAADVYNPKPVVDAVRDTIKEMQRMAEAGAEE